MSNLTMSMFLTKEDLETARAKEVEDMKRDIELAKRTQKTRLAKTLGNYDVLDEDHPDTCRCEVCRFWS